MSGYRPFHKLGTQSELKEAVRSGSRPCFAEVGVNPRLAGLEYLMKVVISYLLIRFYLFF